MGNKTGVTVNAGMVEYVGNYVSSNGQHAGLDINMKSILTRIGQQGATVEKEGLLSFMGGGTNRLNLDVLRTNGFADSFDGYEKLLLQQAAGTHPVEQRDSPGNQIYAELTDEQLRQALGNLVKAAEAKGLKPFEIIAVAAKNAEPAPAPGKGSAEEEKNQDKQPVAQEQAANCNAEIAEKLTSDNNEIVKTLGGLALRVGAYEAQTRKASDTELDGCQHGVNLAQSEKTARAL